MRLASKGEGSKCCSEVVRLLARDVRQDDRPRCINCGNSLPCRMIKTPRRCCQDWRGWTTGVAYTELRRISRSQRPVGLSGGVASTTLLARPGNGQPSAHRYTCPFPSRPGVKDPE